MVNTIVNHQEKLEHYGSCVRAVLTISVLGMLLTGCNMGIGGANFTLKNFDDKNYQPLLQTVAALGYLVGLWFLVFGFLKLKIYGQMRTMMAAHTSIVPPLMYMFVGTILMYLPFVVETSLFTIWGSGDVLAYLGSGSPSSAWTTYFRPIVHIMTLIGYVSFIRGWMVLVRVGGQQSQPGAFNKGFMHIFGGILAINFLGTVEIIRNSFA